MKRIKKLTPATLKRIIAEEKCKIISEQKLAQKSKKLSETKKVQTYLKLLKLLKESNQKRSKDFKKVDKLRSAIKRKLLKEL